MSNNDPDFLFNITVPVFIPTEEEVETVGGILEPNLQFLIDNEYATKDEVIAYIKFVSLLNTSVVFILDEFLKQYRNRP